MQHQQGLHTEKKWKFTEKLFKQKSVFLVKEYVESVSKLFLKRLNFYILHSKNKKIKNYFRCRMQFTTFI